MSITRKDLENEVRRLNGLYKKNDRTAIKFAVSGAYGGYQVILKGNPVFGYSGAHDVTYGHDTARETLSKLHYAESRGLKDDVDRFHKRAMEYSNRKSKTTF
jgi:hypothetical protein